MTAEEEIQEILGYAATYLEMHGWCQNEFHSSDGKHCVMGAAYDACVLLGRSERRKDVRAAIEGRVGTPHVTNWNDAPGRTVEEVLAVLRGT